MKIIKVLLLLLLPITLSGCSGNSDVQNKAFIKEMGVDYDEKQNISLRTFGSDEVISGSGKTLLSAVGECENSQSKNLFSGHLEVFASSPYNIGNNLLTLLSNNRISPSCYVLCIPENAASFIDKQGGKLAALIASSGRNGIIVPETISSVVNDLLEGDSKAAVPTYRDNRLTMAVITPNKLIGTLSDDESRGLCWLCGNVRDIYMPVETDSIKSDFYIRKTNTEITAEKKDNRILITVEIKINGNSEDRNSNLPAVREEVSKNVSTLCANTIAKTVTGMKADLFGIEKTIKSSGISVNSDWEEIIPLLDFSYRIKISQ